MTVISLQNKKYEIERDENGLMVGMWRNGDFWKSGLELFAHAQVFHAALDEIERLSAEPAPIDMVLHCPACGAQHIDAPLKPIHPVIGKAWDNPPHRSHLCHGCGHIWRPADVPTNGVAEIKTKGKNDSPKREGHSNGLAALRDMLAPRSAAEEAAIAQAWPHRMQYVASIGYVVWRDALEGHVPSDAVKAVMDHKVAVFVTESEALAYCEFRNRHVQ